MKIGIIGTGGFASSHHGAIQALESGEECRLICACDPDPERLSDARERWGFDRRGVRVYRDYREMLDAERESLDVVTVPTPIPLHAEMHAACVKRGLACYLEKPPTLDPEELERMIAVDRKAKKATQVAFNFIVEEPRQALKRRLLAGEFGPLRRVSFLGVWPRATSYFARNAWAGRLLGPDGRLILDSCIGNAMAHFIHNVLFWAGTGDLFDWAEPESVEAALYRAHPIEGFDTVFLRAGCGGNVELRIAATHACRGASHHVERVECEKAAITYVTGSRYRIEWRNGAPDEEGEADRRNLLQENFRAYFAYVRGKADRPLTRLSDARPFVHLNALAYPASGEIAAVGGDSLNRAPAPEGEFIEIVGVEDACERFVASGEFPREQGRPWAASRAGMARLEDLSRLPDLVRRMAEAAAS